MNRKVKPKMKRKPKQETKRKLERETEWKLKQKSILNFLSQRDNQEANKRFSKLSPVKFSS